MGVYESNSKINKANKDMGIFWERTKTFWKDAKAEQFEHEFIERLSIEVKRSKDALGNIAIILNRVRSELKDRD